jgi:glycosyltransferase involved in cell wall biosynthesis
VIANCAAIRDEMLAGDPPLARDRFVVIENGVPPAERGDRRRGREQLGVSREARVAVVVGRLAPMKGHATLLRAWVAVRERVPAAVLVLAGEGESGVELRDLARKLDLGESVRFAGFVNGVADVLAASDLFVLPSERDEGCNNALLEAMSHGLAAVVTRCGGLPECVEDGRTGRVVPIGDEKSLASAVAELLLDEPTRSRMGRAARELALERFSPERVAGELERVLREVRELSDRARTARR